MFPPSLDQNLMDEVLGRARLSPRKRAHHCFHRPGDRLQRMVNASLRGSYFAPHRHKNPDKLEIFTILTGKVLVIAFTDFGAIIDGRLLSAGADGDGDGGTRQVEIPPGTWHSLLILSPEAVLYEVIDGHFHPDTHKDFAPWAPSESDSEAGAYLKDLLRRSEGFIGL